ncbi:MAG: hypothetical protein ABIN58_04645 [candidate division WOR-3 bacterium]
MNTVLIALLISQALFARTFGGPQEEYGRSVARTVDGGFAVAGHTASFGAGGDDFLVLKLNSDGSLAWARTFGGAQNDYATSVARTTDGGVVVAGQTGSFGAGTVDFLVLKLNSSGGLSWARTFGGTSGDFAYSITQTSDGGFVVAGSTLSFGAGNYDLLVLKLNSSGGLSWARTFGGTGDDRAYSIIQTTDGGFAVAGWTASFGAGGLDFLVLKLNSSGGLSWARTFGGTNLDGGGFITQTADGGFAVTGYTLNFALGDTNFLVLKLNSSGGLSWARTFGGTNHDYAYSITQAADGGLAVAGYTAGFGAGGDDFLVLKLNSSGGLSWAKSFGGASGDRAYYIAQATDGGFAVVGATQSFGAGDVDLLVFKLDQNGNYPGCVQACSPTTTSPSPSSSSISVGADCSPSTSSPSLTVNTPALTMTDVCYPLYEDVEEADFGSQPRITCSPVSGGLIFRSEVEAKIEIYSAEGRLTYSDQLQEGDNRIILETGVYLWKAGAYRGKAIVR